MINGAHWLLYSKDVTADRAFFRDTLGLQFVDVGQGWLIFKAPPSELALHPVEGEPFVQKHAEHELVGAILYLMCDDIDATLKMLKAKDVPCTPSEPAPWGRFSIIGLPSGGKIGLYQPAHKVAYDL